MFVFLLSSEKPPVVNPYANNESAPAATRAQADAQNTIGNRNRAAIGDSKPYGEGTKYYESPEYAAAVAASKAKEQAYRKEALQRTQEQQQTVTSNSPVSRGAAYEMAMEAERKGEVVDFYVGEKALAQGYVPSSGLYVSRKEDSRQTVPVRDYSSGIGASSVLMTPGGGADFYVPYGSVAKTLIPDAKAVYTPGGQIDIYKLGDARPGFTPRYGRIASSGSDNSLQSGMFTVNRAGTPVVYTRESAGTKFAPGVDAAAANAVLANRKLYSRSGAELYGGDVVLLDGRKIQASTRVDPLTGAQITVTNTPVSTYPASKGNLAGLVDPFAVNKPKAERVANTPWTIDYGTAPIFQVSDQKGNLSPAPADRLAAIGFKAQPIRENVAIKDAMVPRQQPLSTPRYGEPSANADIGVGWHTVDGVDYAIIPGGAITLPASRASVNTASIPVVSTLTGIGDFVLFNPFSKVITLPGRMIREGMNQTFGLGLPAEPTTMNVELKTEGGKIRGDIAEYFNAPITVPISKTPKTKTTGFDMGTRMLEESLTAREPELLAEKSYLDSSIIRADKEGQALQDMFRPGGNWVDKEGYWTGTEAQLAEANTRASTYNENIFVLNARSDAYSKNIDIFNAQATQFEEQYKKNPEMVSTLYAFGDPIRGQSGWDKSNIAVGDAVLIQPVVNFQNKIGIDSSVGKIRTNWDNTIYNLENKVSTGGWTKENVAAGTALAFAKWGKVGTDRPLDLTVKMGEMYAGGMVFRALSAPTTVTSGASGLAEIAAPRASLATRIVSGAKTYALPIGMVGLTGYQGYETITAGGKDYRSGKMVSRATEFGLMDVFPMFAGGIAGFQNRENVVSLRSALRGGSPGGSPFGGRPFGENGGINVEGRNYDINFGREGYVGASQQPGNPIDVGHWMPKNQYSMMSKVAEGGMDMPTYNRFMSKRAGQPGYPETWSGDVVQEAQWSFKPTNQQAGVPQPQRLLTSELGGGAAGKVPQPPLGGAGAKLPEMPKMPEGTAISTKPPTIAGTIVEQPVTKMPGGQLRTTGWMPDETIVVSGKELATRSPGGISTEVPTLKGSILAPAVASAGAMSLSAGASSFTGEINIVNGIPLAISAKQLETGGLVATTPGMTMIGDPFETPTVTLTPDWIQEHFGLKEGGTPAGGAIIRTPETQPPGQPLYRPLDFTNQFGLKPGMINPVTGEVYQTPLESDLPSGEMGLGDMGLGDMGLEGMGGEGMGIEGLGGEGLGFNKLPIYPVDKLKTGLLPPSGKLPKVGSPLGKLPWETTLAPGEEVPLPKNASPKSRKLAATAAMFKGKKFKNAHEIRVAHYDLAAVMGWELPKLDLATPAASRLNALGLPQDMTNLYQYPRGKPAPVKPAMGAPRLTGIKVLALPAGGKVITMESPSFRPHMGAPRLPGIKNVPMLTTGTPDFAGMMKGNAGMPRFGYRPGEAIPMGAARIFPDEMWQPGGKMARKANWLNQQQGEVLLGLDKNANTVFQKYSDPSNPHRVTINDSELAIMKERGVETTIHRHLSGTPFSAGDQFSTGAFGFKGMVVTIRNPIRSPTDSTTSIFEGMGKGNENFPKYIEGKATNYRDSVYDRIDREVSTGQRTKPKFGENYWHDTIMESNLELSEKKGWIFTQTKSDLNPTGNQMLQMFKEQPTAAEIAVRRHEARLGIGIGFEEDIASSASIRVAPKKGAGYSLDKLDTRNARAEVRLDSGQWMPAWVNKISPTDLNIQYKTGLNDIELQTGQLEGLRGIENYNLQQEHELIPRPKFGEGRPPGVGDSARDLMGAALTGGHPITLVARDAVTGELTGGLAAYEPIRGQTQHVAYFATVGKSKRAGGDLFDVLEGIGVHKGVKSLNLIATAHGQPWYIKRGFSPHMIKPSAGFNPKYAAGQPTNPPMYKNIISVTAGGLKGEVTNAELYGKPVKLVFAEDIQPPSRMQYPAPIQTLDLRQTVDLTNVPVPTEESPSAIFTPAPYERFKSPVRTKASAGSGNKWVNQQRIDQRAGKNMKLEEMQLHGDVSGRPTMSQEGARMASLDTGMGGMEKLYGAKEGEPQYQMIRPGFVTPPPVVKPTIGGIGQTTSAVKVFEAREAAKVGKQPEYYWGQLGAEKGVRGKWQFERMIEKQQEWEKARTGTVGIEKTDLYKLGKGKRKTSGITGSVSSPVRQGAGNPDVGLLRGYGISSGLQVEAPPSMFPPMNRRRHKLYVEQGYEYANRIPPGMTRPKPQGQTEHLAQMSGLGMMTEASNRQETLLAERQKLRQDIAARQKAGQLARQLPKSEVIAAQQTQLRAIERGTQIAQTVKTGQVPATKTQTGTSTLTIPRTIAITDVATIPRTMPLTKVEPKLSPVPVPRGEIVPRPSPRVQPRPEPIPRPVPRIGGTPTLPPIGGVPFPFPLPGTPNAGGGEGANWRSLMGFREHSPTITPGEMARSLFTGSFTERKQPRMQRPTQRVYGTQKGSFRSYSGTVKVIPLRAPKKGRRK